MRFFSVWGVRGLARRMCASSGIVALRIRLVVRDVVLATPVERRATRLVSPDDVFLGGERGAVPELDLRPDRPHHHVAAARGPRRLARVPGCTQTSSSISASSDASGFAVPSLNPSRFRVLVRPLSIVFGRWNPGSIQRSTSVRASPASGCATRGRTRRARRRTAGSGDRRACGWGRSRRGGSAPSAAAAWACGPPGRSGVEERRADTDGHRQAVGADPARGSGCPRAGAADPASARDRPG